MNNLIKRLTINKLRRNFSNSVTMSNQCRVAVCQFTATNNKEDNLKIIKKLISNAVAENSKMIFIPEGSDYIASNKSEAIQMAEPLTGFLISEYRNLAKQNHIWISVGGVHEKNEETVYNSHILIDEEGTIRSVYRKIHLFEVTIPERNIYLRESEVCTGGSQILAPVNTPGGSLGLAICYDLRFPELSILQTKMGATILTFPSAFTHATGQAHWEVLLRARAIENQCYVIAAAQYGKHNNKRISYGHSLVIDPWGTIIAECPKYTEGIEKDESIAFAEINTELLTKIRQDMPTFQHRRNDIYNLNLITNKNSELNNDDIYSFADKTILGSTVFYRSKYCFAFTNIRCVVPGHVLISTLRVARRLHDLTQEEISDLFQTVVTVQKIVEQEHNAISSTICVQDGHFAGQTIPHVHVHVLPRKEGDFKNNDDVYFHLAKHDRDDNPQPFRNSEEMISEAKQLRKYFA